MFADLLQSHRRIPVSLRQLPWLEPSNVETLEGIRLKNSVCAVIDVGRMEVA